MKIREMPLTGDTANGIKTELLTDNVTSLYHSQSSSDGASVSNRFLELEVNPLINGYYPKLLSSLHACLSVLAALAIKDRTKPLSLILETPSGYGKSAVLQMLFPQSPDIEKYILRSDGFTPKSFVSHAANVKVEELKKIDLLPKLKNKVMVTKELAPLFRGREEELRHTFSTLITVLDGKGLTTDSGMRGSRGYKEPIIFNWLGATTPLPATTHRLMSQLGTRLLFWEVPASEPTEEELMEYAIRGDTGTAEIECNIAVNKFILEFFKLNPLGTVELDSIHFPQDLLGQLVKWARFLVKARSEIKFEKSAHEWEPIAAMPPEGAWKVINYFKELAIGHALINERRYINQSDLDLVAHVAISSIPNHLRPIIKTLRKEISLSSTKGMKACLASKPTVRKRFKELEILEIVKLTKGSSQTNEADTVELSKEFQWLRE